MDFLRSFKVDFEQIVRCIIQVSVADSAGAEKSETVLLMVYNI